MARRPGDRNRDFDAKREAILARLEPRLLAPDAATLSFHEMAEAADVSPSSLRHHLGSRSEVVAAVLARMGQKGAPFLAMVAAAPELPVEASLRWLLGRLVLGLNHGLAEMVGMGLAMGMRDERVGPAFLDAMLEPLLQAVEARLAHHARAGELVDTDLRLAALALVSPIVLGAVHQRGLAGHLVRPLSLDSIVDETVRRFLRGYGA